MAIRYVPSIGRATPMQAKWIKLDLVFTIDISSMLNNTKVDTKINGVLKPF